MATSAVRINRAPSRPVPDFDSYEELLDAGVHEVDIGFFKRANIAPREAWEWYLHNLSGNDAREYIAVGVTTPTQAVPWRDIGVTGDDIAYYRMIGVTTPEAAQRWKEANISGDDVVGYLSVNVTTFEEAVRWQKAGISGADAHYYAQAGIYTFEEAIRWQKANVGRAQTVLKYIRSGIITRHEAVELSASIKSTRDMFGFFLANVDTVDEIARWEEAGIHGREAFCYITIGMHTLAAALTWKNSGIDGYQVQSIDAYDDIAAVAAMNGLPPPGARLAPRI